MSAFLTFWSVTWSVCAIWCCVVSVRGVNRRRKQLAALDERLTRLENARQVTS